MKRTESLRASCCGVVLLVLAVALSAGGCMTGMRGEQMTPAEQLVAGDTELACESVLRYGPSSWEAPAFSSPLWQHLAKRAAGSEYGARSKMAELMRSYTDVAPSCTEEVIRQVELGG